MESEEEIEERLIAQLEQSPMPCVWLPSRVALSHAILPSRGESAHMLVGVYEAMGRGVSCPDAGSARETWDRPTSVCPDAGSARETWDRPTSACVDAGSARRTWDRPTSACVDAGSARGTWDRPTSACVDAGSAREMSRDQPETEQEWRCDLCEQQRSVESWDPVSMARRHMQRRMLGYLVKIIFEVQDFMGAWLYKNSDRVTAEEQRKMEKMNGLMLPWVRGVAKIIQNKTWEKIDELWKEQGEVKGIEGAVVYARLDLQSNHMYVGETTNWTQRVKRHAYMTFRHSLSCTKRCKGCAEHIKYNCHRVAPAHRWLMVPLKKCEDKEEAKKLEHKLQKQWKPNMNQGDKKVWAIKFAYVSDYKTRAKKDNRDPPWRKKMVEAQVERNRVRMHPKPYFGFVSKTEKVEKSQRRMVTKYTYKGEETMDLLKIIQRNEGETFQITVTPGVVDLTDWRKIRKEYGKSFVRVIYGDTPSKTLILREWNREDKTPKKLCISVEKTQPCDLKEILVAIEKQDKHFMMQDDTENGIEFFWRVRNDVDKEHKYKWRQMLWVELQRRYPDLPRKPIEVRLPYFQKVDVCKLREYIKGKIEATNWPGFLKQWHSGKFKIVTEGQPTISEILCNVQKPNKLQTRCCCEKVQKRMGNLPKTNGHVFFIGRDCKKDSAKVLNVTAGNVPIPGWREIFTAWGRIQNQLPQKWRVEKNEWKQQVFKILKKGKGNDMQENGEVPTTKQVWKEKSKMEGLIIGPLDKNGGELWACCPRIYFKALSRNYNYDKGYEIVYPAKLSAYRKKRYSTEELPAQICRRQQVPKNQRGTERDIVELWRKIYKEKGWDKYAKFERKGGFNQPYVLFKAKNVIEKEIREEKMEKIRPIAPGTRHPMRKLLHYVGRAWSFITAQLPYEERVVINHGGEVPNFLRKTGELRDLGEVRYKLYDIEGCYPNMPKETIRFAMRAILNEIKEKCGQEQVMVPIYSDKRKCEWKTKRKGMQAFPFEVMLDVMEFSLDNALVKMPNGVIKRQVQGIPMGDPISPGMTIGTCAWMEKQWLEELHYSVKRRFKMKRFMDDILIAYARSEKWDHEKFLRDFEKSTVYQEPLKLENGREGTFLETTFECDANGCNFWLKNDNGTRTKRGGMQLWRYQHFHSYSPLRQKTATLMACLKKVHAMASDAKVLHLSALDKIAEFKTLGYPTHILRKACANLGNNTGNVTWFQVRNEC